MQTAVATANIPHIQQQPKTVSDTAIHYGYCAFKEINLCGSTGQEHFVQPANSPYYKILPAKELIPYTNIEVTEHRPDSSGIGPGMLMNQRVVFQKFPKTAKECVGEMVNSYEEWGYQSLTSLIGYSEDEAFQIFQTIQPFIYRLKDLPYEIERAEERIKADAPYAVCYEGEEFELQPLPAHLREVAEKTRQIMAVSVKTGVTLAETIKDNTNLALITAYSGGGGKRTPDPRDKYVAQELGHEFPKLLDDKNGTPGAASMSADEMELRREELAEKKRENNLRAQELAMKNGATGGMMADPSAATGIGAGINAKPECGDTGGTTLGGAPCKMPATAGGRCAKHPQEEEKAA